MSGEDEAYATQMRRRYKLFSELVATEGWKEYVAILSAQHQGHLGELVKPPEASLDGMAQSLTSEFRKGAVFALAVAIATPHATMEDAKQFLASEMKEQENASGRNSSSDSNTRSAGNLSADEQLELQLGPDTVVTDLG